MAARKTGRPRKLDDALRKKILKTLSDGGSRNDAAALCGIATSTIQNEAERNEAFAVELKKAEAECKLHHIRRVRGGNVRWQSSAWFLERKWPKQFAAKPVEPVNPGDGQGDPDESDLLTSNPALEAAQVPPGAIPSLGPPGAVQDDPCRPAVGEDGALREAQAGVVAVGLPDPPKALA